MIRGIAQEIRTALRKETLLASVALGQDYLVEEFDGGVLVGAFGFPFVDEFVEGLSLPQHIHVLRIAVRDAAEELIHVEMVV